MNQIKTAFKLLLLLCIVSCNNVLAQKCTESNLVEDFKGAFVKKKSVRVSDGWQRKVIYGNWVLQEDGALSGENIPEQKHGPLLTYSSTIEDAIVECEFMLPVEGTTDQHFRIFLSSADYLGHTVSAMYNTSTRSYKKGITLRHFRKDKNKKMVENLDLDAKSAQFASGVWHKFQLEMIGDKVVLKIDNKEVKGKHEVLNVAKNQMSINFGKAGGAVRNFKVTQK